MTFPQGYVRNTALHALLSFPPFLLLFTTAVGLLLYALARVIYSIKSTSIHFSRFPNEVTNVAQLATPNSLTISSSLTASYYRAFGMDEFTDSQTD